MPYTIPATYDIDTGDLLYQWLGSFWSGICEDADFLRKMYQANGILSAQLYQEFSDALNLSDRNKAPIFHRKRWFPITIYLSNRNNTDACGIKLDMDPSPVVGPQTDSSFDIGEVFEIGGSSPYSNVTAYTLDATIKSIASITDNIADPNVIYLDGVNYIIRDSVIYFLDGQDPFDNTNFTTKDYEDTRQITLWCVDTLLDRDYIYKYIGYVLGINQASSEGYKKATNSLWDVYNSGATVELVNVAIGALLGEPVTLSDTETVEVVIDSGDIKQVVTDANVYTFNSSSDLDAKIIKGYELSKGEFFTDTVKLYTNLDTTKLHIDNPSITRLRADIPALFLPPQFFRAKLDHGIGVNWELTDVVNNGIDANSNYKYSFDVYGYPEDIEALWEDIWEYCETNNVACKDILEGYVDDNHSSAIGSIVGRISPLEFFMYNCLKANTLTLVIDLTKLSDFGKSNIKLLRELYKILPAHTYTFVIEKISDICDNYDLEVDSAGESELGVALGISSYAYYGKVSTQNLTYGDRVTKLQWIPVCSGSNV